MPKVYLQLISKNHALFGERIEFDSDVIPRVGELIDAHQFLSLHGEVSDFMVKSVIYKMTEHGFVPYITAHQWYKGYRDEFLQSRGWLPGGHDNRSYDEDDEARLENA